MATRLRGKLFGYDKKQVNTLLSDKSAQYEDSLAVRQERINALRDENHALKEEVALLRDREQSVVNALVHAQQQAAQIIEDARRDAETLNNALVEENKLLHRRTLDMFDAIHDYYTAQLADLDRIRDDLDRCAQRVQRHQQDNQEARRAFIKLFLAVCDGPAPDADQPPTAHGAPSVDALSAALPAGPDAGIAGFRVLR